jgi:hypothetical protein
LSLHKDMPAALGKGGSDIKGPFGYSRQRHVQAVVAVGRDWWFRRLFSAALSSTSLIDIPEGFVFLTT